MNLDGCVEVDAAYYGLPPGGIGREVNVQWDELYVRILDPQNGLLLREHVRQKRGWYRIKKEEADSLSERFAATTSTRLVRVTAGNGQIPGDR